MLENVRQNLRAWDEVHDWPANGDEWRGQAEMCAVPYNEWKASLVEHLIRPYATAAEVIEIAPGHGRWSEHIVAACRYVTLVDLSPKCLEACRKIFINEDKVDYFLTIGTQLPRYASGKVDMVFSFDSFVHMAEPVIEAYMFEIFRVLTAGGVAVLHHADIAEPVNHNQDRHPGWRSAINRSIMTRLGEAAGLAITDQLTFWDTARRIGVPRFGDVVSILRKP